MPKRERQERTSGDIQAHYEEVITKRSLKFIPEESLKNEFKKTVIRQKEIDQLWSSRKRDRNGNPPGIDGLIEGINKELDKIMDVEDDPLREFYKKMLTAQKSVLEGLQKTETTDNVSAHLAGTASDVSQSSTDGDVPMDLG